MAALQPSLAAIQSSPGKVARKIDREDSWFDGNMVPSTRTEKVLCLPSLADEVFNLGVVFAVVCLAATVGCPLLRWLKLPRHLKCVLGGLRKSGAFFLRSFQCGRQRMFLETLMFQCPESRNTVLNSGADFSFRAPSLARNQMGAASRFIVCGGNEIGRMSRRALIQARSNSFEHGAR